tara:strand:- start:1323 stop:2651 length:1329 start_codon:yes stop_codon:yes gene_type:complete
MPKDIFETGRRYTVELIVDGSKLYLNERIIKVSIINSMASIWPLIILDLKIDNNYIIDEDLFGKKSLLLTIKTEILNIPGHAASKEQIEFELLYMYSNLNLTSKVADPTGKETSQQDYQYLSLTTIPVPSIKTMTTSINTIFEEEIVQDPLELIIKALEEVKIKTEKIKALKKNAFKYDQFIVPPMSVNQMVDYVNEKCGIYQGSMFKYCDYEGNLLLWNLNEEIKKNGNIIIEQPRHDYDIFEFNKLKEKTADGKHFVTLETVGSATNSNVNILDNGYEHIFMTDPERELFFNLEKTSDDISKMQEKQSDLGIHKVLKEIKTYHSTLKGYRYQTEFLEDDDNNSFATTKVSSNIKSNDSLEIKFGRLTSTINSDDTIELQLLKLLEVGKCAEYVPNSMPYLDRYQGKYILESSTIILNRIDSEQWNPTASLILTRTHKVAK